MKVQKNLSGRVPRTLSLAMCALVLITGCPKDAPTEPTEPPLVEITPFDVVPANAVIRRLTQEQYKNSIRDTLGPKIVVAGSFEPDSSIGGLLTVGAGHSTISSWGVEQYERLSYKLAEQVFTDATIRAAHVPCAEMMSFDENCARDFITAIGLKLWRRSLSTEEITELVEIARQATMTLGSLDAGLQFPLATMLQSPNFLFRIELGETDPSDAAIHRYNNYEMASRLSFFMWNTVPDAPLLEAAQKGELVTDEGLLKQYERMIASPLSRAGLNNFFTELFELQHLDEMTKDPKIFLHFNSNLGSDAREETLRVIEDHVFDQDADYRDLFTTQKTFINRRLAALYEVRAPTREGFSEFTFEKEHGRRGLLGHASLLALNSHAVASSATLRGKFIRQTLLCGIVPPPPVNVDTALPEPSGTAVTLRQRIGEHLMNPACASCHLLIDPIGLGLENFDGIGRYRLKEEGAVIDASGDIDKTPFADAWEMAEVVRNHGNLSDCLVKNLYQYATGNIAVAGELGQVKALGQMFQNDRYRVKTLVRNIILSPGFRRVQEVTP